MPASTSSTSAPASPTSRRPANVNAAAHAAIDAGYTKYTPSAGGADIREAVCHRYREDYGVAFTPAEVIATAGGKQALFNAAVALFEPGDEVDHPRAVLADDRRSDPR